MKIKRKSIADIDKGFAVLYHKLSYRRKFIRTLWCIPWAVVVIGIFHMYFASIAMTLIASIIMMAVFLLQASYTYRRWKENE